MREDDPEEAPPIQLPGDRRLHPLSSEGDPLHGAPGLVDLVSTNGFNPIDTLPVSYTNAVGSTPSTLSLSIPLADFSANQINLLDTGSFSVIVGNVNNATDFLAPSSVPEPSAVVLLAIGLSSAGLGMARARRRMPRDIAVLRATAALVGASGRQALQRDTSGCSR